jgi:hypothetical protein
MKGELLLSFCSDGTFFYSHWLEMLTTNIILFCSYRVNYLCRVSLEVLEDGAPKPPSESDSDGLPKLYIHHTAFMKVLGGTMDIEIQKDGSFEPTFKDREGNELDPNN